MAVVVSDTTPLHYLILVDQEAILEKLYGKVFLPPAVLAELGHPSAPPRISTWAANPPSWVIIVTPRSIPERYEELDLGERQALALAKEIHADLILLHDRVARRAATRESIRVKGTLGIVADAGTANLLNFPETVGKLQRTSMHLDQDVVEAVMKEFKDSNRKR